MNLLNKISYMTKRNKIIGLIIVVALLVGGGVFVSYRTRTANAREEQTVLQKIGDKKELLEIYDKVKRAQTVLQNPKDESEEVGNLLSLGNNWKALAELTKDDYFYSRALAAFEEGIRKFGHKNVIFYWNGGGLAENHGDFALAEHDYKESIRIAPTYGEGYIKLAELYRFRMKKSQDEVEAVYKQGRNANPGNGPLLLENAAYLKEVGRFKDALEEYKLLLKVFPGNAGYEQNVRDLEAKL